MKLDGAIFRIEPRSVGGCIDLAVVFLRENFAAMATLVVLFAIPSSLFHYWLVDACEWPTMVALLLFTLECPFFAAILVNTAGVRAFGDQFSIRAGIRATFKRIISYTLLVAATRLVTAIGAFFFLFPAYLLATRYGFLAEVLYLERSPVGRYEKRLNDLLSKAFFQVLGRLIVLLSFYAVTVITLFVLIDISASTLFGIDVMIGRFTGPTNAGDELEWYLLYDPLVCAVLTFAMWVMYAITRLAWLFCYLDVRIRKEGWDLEIDARVERRRLEAVA